MTRFVSALCVLMLGGSPVLAKDIVLTSEWGTVNARLADNEAGKAIQAMLPFTISMRDHLRQEKTGNLPAPIPEIARQREFEPGTLGIWGPDHFVIYYKGGAVPAPGIVIVGDVDGGASMFDRPGPVSVRVEAAP